ncbi:cytochrome b [Stutzerimonas tarimensis]|uniref:Cytochrome b n=1 Tax=Stutzerimonas tarimensis TaxID=1507735 RepID=A0ABV7T5V4_9GAMM
MQWCNSEGRYGLTSIILHWSIAVAFLGLFALGYWMVGLNYYSDWYQTAPHWHKSVGMLLFALMLLRLLWRLLSTGPAPLPAPPGIRLLTRAVHGGLYLGLFALMISGYLISTANGRPVSVFGWFEVPALVSGLPGQADLAGSIHEILAWALLLLVGLHALAALKHHFIDRDPTLVRMLGRDTLR